MLRLATWLVLASPAGGEIDFDRDVRPLLADRCLPCHGPDDATRKANLRLDQDYPNPPLLLERIEASDPRDRMPPVDSGKTLDDDERAILRQWIEGGARWHEHWSFVAPERPDVPAVSDPGWVLAKAVKVAVTVALLPAAMGPMSIQSIVPGILPSPPPVALPNARKLSS